MISPERTKPGAGPGTRDARRRRFARKPAAMPLWDHGLTEASAAAAVALRERLYRRTLAASDALAAGVCLLVVIGVQAGGQDILFWSLAAMPLIVLVNKVAGLYDRDGVVLNRSTLDEVPTLVQISGLFSLIVWLGHWQLFKVALTPEFVLELWCLLSLALVLGRIGARSYATARARPERCLVLGDPTTVDTVTRKLENGRLKVDVVAAVPLGSVGVDPRALAPLIRQHDVHRIVLAPAERDTGDVLELVRVAKALGVSVSLIPRLLEVVGSSAEFDHLDGLTILGVRRFRLTRSSFLLKRAFDLIGATVALVVLLPLIVGIAIAIRVESPGPLLFRQTRVGRGGRHFQMLKFRSMVADADARKEEVAHLNEASGLFKIAADPRITRVGSWLRRTSLDELPQLLNVWRGEMSLVGPRPLVVDEDAKIEGLKRSRLQLTPGMTGHWQILGSARIPLDEMVAIDYLYVANWSLWNDVKLLLRTVPFVLGRRGL